MNLKAKIEKLESDTKANDVFPARIEVRFTENPDERTKVIDDDRVTDHALVIHFPDGSKLVRRHFDAPTTMQLPLTPLP